MLKAIFFDIDDTLYSYTEAHACAMPVVCREGAKVLGITPEAFRAEYKAQTDAMLRQAPGQAACHNRQIRFLRILEAHHAPLSLAPVWDRLYWETLLEHSRPEPGVTQCLLALRAKGYAIGAASNMTLDWQLRKLEKLGLLPCFDWVITSEEAGAEKPSAQFYALCVQYAGCAPEECCMVGDSFAHDVRAAREAGLHALWYTPHGSEEGLQHFAELEARLDVLQREE